MILYYSATGNTEWVARRLSTLLSDTHVVSASIAKRALVQHFQSMGNDESLGLFFPVHAWGLPMLVEEAFKAIPTDRFIPYIYMVCTCGDDIGLTDHLVRKLLSDKGLECQSCYSVQMPNTYVALPGFDVDSAEVEELKLIRAEARLLAIAEAVKARKKEVHVTPGGAAWLKSKVLRPLFNRFLVTDRFFKVDEKCVGCGKCAKSCPVGNIRMGDTPVWMGTGRCNTCLACYHTCPYHAIAFGRYTKHKGQYIHPDRG